HVVRRCLAKDPDERWQSASDVMRELSWISKEGSAASVVSSVQVSRKTGKRLALGVVAGTVLGALLASIAWNVRPEAQPPALSRLDMVLPPGQHLTGLGLTRHNVALSPDGTRLVYSANDQLYLRKMAEPEATPIPGTDSARSVFFSPDGESVGFWSQGGKLKKVSISGGASLTLCDAGVVWGASWGLDDTIVYGQSPEGILRVSANGGTPEVLIGAEGHRFRQPEILPGGKAILFTAAASDGSWGDRAQIRVQLLETGAQRVLVQGGTDARYVPTGHLVYSLAGSLLAVPFDLDRLEVTGGPVPLLESVMTIGTLGAAQFSFSRNGSLVYVAGSASLPESALVSVDRQGVARPLIETLRFYSLPRFSPDGQRVALTIGAAGGRDIWIYELVRGTLTRLTFEGGSYPELAPVWWTS
ncbi:MAG: hypothetical protein VST64_10440, partial [Nitrospirota bacterium]|nr:hypothetical protein [Nitrospirota bacterium]